MADGTYLYAVAREPLPPGEPLAGVAEAPVRTIARNGLVAYVSTVPLDGFGEEPLKRSLEDLDWLAETARAHHRVVDAVAAVTTTAPVRLVTVYAGDDQVTDLLERRGEEFHRVLSHVTGRQEWGVKVYTAAPEPGATGLTAPGLAASGLAASGLAASGLAASGPAARAAAMDASERAGSGAGASSGGSAGVSSGGAAVGEDRRGRDGEARAARRCPNGDERESRPGRAYLERRRASLRGREQLRAQALRRADHIHRTLSALAADGCRHRPQDPRLSGRNDWMLLNGAYLVDESRAAEFTELAGTLGGDGVEVRLTGPWAPYSFTVMETA
ncbi:GvpL/GvpF family gas vesicle protein [Nonomuraea sp. NPDC049309]|uniref:GvpL/GvpF family gas vesicle protein n=1 Tax=Nonomuraea sp. NPDC049309 TaxID=3364350 RepID=UPI00370FAB8B